MMKKFLLFILLCTTKPLFCNPTAESLQMILAIANDWADTTGYMQRYERTSTMDPWTAVGGKIDVSFGLNGLGWGLGLHNQYLKVEDIFVDDPCIAEGAKKSPVGVFALNIAFGKADKSEPDAAGIKLDYIKITPTIWGVDDVKSQFYNRIKDSTQVVKDWDSAEDMYKFMNEGVYEFGVYIEHNYEKPIPRQGSCFFMHVHRGPGVPTAGCTACSRDEMKEVLFWLDPTKKPILTQLPKKNFDTLKAEWKLPELTF